MRNDFSAAQLTKLRQRPQSADWYLAIHKPAILGEFVVTNHSLLLGSALGQVPVLGTNESSALAGMTGLVYDTNGSWLGDIRIRKNWPGNINQLDVAEAGSGLINWGTSSTIKVIDQYRPWIKHPRYNAAASQWLMDFDIPYDGQLNNFLPYSNPGTPVVALPASSGKWVVDFYGDDSVSFFSGASWTFPDGQQVTSALGTSSAPVKMTFDNASPGGSYFSLAITAGNGTSHLGRRLIFAVNDVTEFPKVQVSDITGGIESGGYQARFLAAGNPVAEITESAYPYLDNSELVVFEKANYGLDEGSVGGNVGHRENIIFRGWVKNKEMRVGAFSSDMLLTAENIGGIMQEADSYDIFLANYQSGGSDWTEVKDLTLDKTTQFALQWRSTIGEICDWTPMGSLGDTETLFYQDLPRAPFFSQLQQNYGEKGVMGYFSSDLQSNLFAFEDVLVSGGSAALPFTAIESEDKRDFITISTPPRDLNAQVKLYAVSSDIPYGAESPAKVRGYFGGERVQERGLLADNQERIIQWSGNLRAKLNSKFPRTSIPLANNMRIDPVPQSAVQVSTAASDNARGITWGNKNFLGKELNATYDATLGYPLWDMVVEEVVDGIGGSSITFPTIDDLVPMPTNPPPPGDLDFPVVPPTTDTFGDGFGTVYVMDTDALYRTRDFSASPPTWADISPTTGVIFSDWILDPWLPAESGFLLTDSGVYRSLDLSQSSPSWELMLSASQILTDSGAATFDDASKIIGSINLDQYLAFIWADDTDIYCTYTLNSRAATPAWFHVFIASGRSNFGAKPYHGALDIVPHTNSQGSLTLYMMHSDGVHPNKKVSIRKSTNLGASWALVSDIDTGTSNSAAFTVHVPYNGNPDGNILYISKYADATAARGVQKSTDAGASFSGMLFSGSNSEVTRWGVESYTNNLLKMYFPIAGDFHVSDDGIDSESTATGTGLSGTIGATGGFPTTDNQFYTVTTTGVFVSIDRGENWTDKTGSITIGAVPYVIVPLWTE